MAGASGTYVVPGINTGYKPGDAGASDLWVIGTKAADVEDVAAQVALLLRPDDGVGVIVLMNGDWSDPAPGRVSRRRCPAGC